MRMITAMPKREESRLQGLQYRAAARTVPVPDGEAAKRYAQTAWTAAQNVPVKATDRAAPAAPRRREAGNVPEARVPPFPYTLLKLLVPVLCIVLLLLVVKLAKPESRTKETEGPTAVETMEATEASQEETESSGPVYRTTDVLNVRPEPSTSSERIGQLNAGVTVEYVRAYDSDWAVILYNGKEAYVASQYLTAE